MILYEVWAKLDYMPPEGRPLIGIVFPPPNLRRPGDIPKETENFKILRVPDGWMEFGNPAKDKPLFFTSKVETQTLVSRSSLLFIRERTI